MGRKIGAVPDSIKILAEQLQQFRSTHAVRTRLPEALWQKAVDAARQHGIYVVAHTLRLDYSNLQKRLGGAQLEGRVHRDAEKDSGDRAGRKKLGGVPQVSSSAFVELARSVGVGGEVYVVEFESGTGLRMRVR